MCLRNINPVSEIHQIIKENILDFPDTSTEQSKDFTGLYILQSISAAFTNVSSVFAKQKRST